MAHPIQKSKYTTAGVLNDAFSEITTIWALNPLKLMFVLLWTHISFSSKYQNVFSLDWDAYEASITMSILRRHYQCYIYVKLLKKQKGVTKLIFYSLIKVFQKIDTKQTVAKCYQ